MNVKTLVISLVLVCVAPFAAAEKIVVLDLNAAMFLTDFAKKKSQELEKSEAVIAMQSKFDALAADLQAMDKEAQANGLTWNDDQRTDHGKKRAFVQQNLQLTQKQFQTEQKVLQELIMKEVQPKLEVVIKQITDSEGIDMIISRQAAIFASEKINITAKVVKALNKELKKSKK